VRRRLLVVGLAAACLGWAPWALAAPDFASLGIQAYDPPKPAPPFSLPDLDGRTTTLAELRGKVVMLFFWTTW